MIPSQTAGQCWTCRRERTAAKYNCYDCCVMIYFMSILKRANRKHVEKGILQNTESDQQFMASYWKHSELWWPIRTLTDPVILRPAENDSEAFRKGSAEEIRLGLSLLYEVMIFFDVAVTCHTGNTVTQTRLLSTDLYTCDFIINDFYQTGLCDYYIST